ncbi:hypothetical protein BCR44DRAFT_1437738 [Catenaria anguillulae PL171]|uniref:Ubiquitin-like protease family profile domain-containing protein n=1 Tax=Catenaria anguillulae PL171 TaxID=765915 RepID=A0A1Y2HL91_9FUNG|nr:hypothetical protein BCR44DRAFT_1437738 [Catenaria anguillulae PL171]
MMSHNSRPAASLAKIVSRLLGWPSSACSIQNGTCPQQINGSDCGVAVVAVAEHVWQHSHPNPSSLRSVSLDQYRSELLDRMSEQVERAYTDTS